MKMYVYHILMNHKLFIKAPNDVNSSLIVSPKKKKSPIQLLVLTPSEVNLGVISEILEDGLHISVCHHIYNSPVPFLI